MVRDLRTKEEEREFKPFEKQREFIESDAANMLYAGGMGCGKSRALCVRAVIFAMRMPGTLGLIGRGTYGELQRSTIKTFFDLFPELENYYAVKDMELRLPNGSSIIFQHLDLDDREMGKVKDMTLCWFAIDQLEEISEEVYDLLETRLRQSNIDPQTGRDRYRRYAFSSCNPLGHNWVWRRWIRDASANRWVKDHATGEEIVDENGNKLPNYRIIESTTFDNPTLPNDYLQRLMQSGRSRAWVNRYVYGSWESYEGLVYDNYDAKIHHCSRTDRVPEGAQWIVSCDPGFENPCAVLLCALDYDDVLWVVGEHYADKMTAREHSGKIREMVAGTLEAQGVLPQGTTDRVMAEWGTRSGQIHEIDWPDPVWAGVKERISYWVIDPAGSAHTGTGENLSWIEEFARYKIYFESASRTTDNMGIVRLQERFARRTPGGKGAVRISDACYVLPEELAAYEWAKFRGSGEQSAPEKPRKWKDHAPNALEFASTAFFSNVRHEEEQWSSPTLAHIAQRANPSGRRPIQMLGNFKKARHWMEA